MTEPGKFRILVLGGQRVGKRSFCIRFTENKFEQKDYIPNPAGFDTYSREATINDVKHYIELVYVPSGEQSNSVVDQEVLSCVGCILMYSIEHRPTFDKAKELYRTIRSAKGDYFPIILLGHKADLSQRREVSTHEVQSLAQLYGITFYEASAKSGECVESVVLDLLQKILSTDRDTKKTPTCDETKKRKSKPKTINIKDKCATQ